MTSLPGAITVTNLDHLGLVAGMIDEIGIVEKINDLVGSQPGEKVSPGQAVKAIRHRKAASWTLYPGYQCSGYQPVNSR